MLPRGQNQFIGAEVELSPNSQGTLKFNLPTTGYFEPDRVNIIALDTATWQPVGYYILVTGIRVQRVAHPGTSQEDAYSGDPVPIELLAGNGQLPGLLSAFEAFREKGIVEIEVQNIHTTSTIKVLGLLMGILKSQKPTE